MKATTLLLCTVASLAIGFIASVSGAVGNVVTFDGRPSNPQTFNLHSDFPQFDVQVHSRNQPSWGDHSLPAESYDHGMDCGGSPNSGSFPQHTHTSYEDAVFICNDHVMTANAGSGYGAVVITPNRLIDLSDGETVKVSFRSSTFRHSDRDWLEFGFTPWEDNITIPCRFCPDLQGEPDEYVSLHMSQENGGTGFALYENGQIRGGICPCYESWLTPDKARRDLFEIEFSNTGMTLSMPEYGKVLKDVSFQDLGWGPVVFQMIHHSYDPQKGHPMHGGEAGPTTWHWDDISITPSTPFEIIKSDKRALLRDGPGVMGSLRFGKPAPDDAYLRFASFANPDISFDGGASWVRAQAQSPRKHVATESYFIPVPKGTQEVHFRANCVDWYCEQMHVKDVTIWSSTGGATAPPGSTSTPSAGITSTPITEPIPTSTPSAHEFEVLYSDSSGREDPVSLAGAVVSGNIYPFLTPENGSVQRVSFWLNEPDMGGPATQVESLPPYDFLGGEIDSATAFDTTALTDGSQTITTRVELTGGASTVFDTTFTVANGGASSPPPVSSDFSLLFSKSRNRAGAVSLAGAQVSGRIYAFVTPERNDVERVSFWLNDVDMRDQPRQVEDNAPYDFGGGDASTAVPFDTRWVSNGTHTITTKVELVDGTSIVFDTTFRVAH